MNYLVCTVFVIGSLSAAHTIRYKREILQEPAHENQIQQQDVIQSSQIANSNYDTDGQAEYNEGARLDESQVPVDGEKISHITITKEIPIHQPVPVPVAVEKTVPRPIYVDVPVAIYQPYYVRIDRPYPVPVYKDIPYTVYKDVSVPVKVAVEVPYPVKVPVLVPHPVPIPIDVPVKVPYQDVKVIKKPVVLEHHEGSSNNNNIGNFDTDDAQYTGSVTGHVGNEDQTVAHSLHHGTSITSTVNNIDKKD